jgi:DNA-binding LytR/AlgR family response regulator
MTTIKLPGHSTPIQIQDIMHLRGENNYTWFYLASGQRILSSLNLGYYETILIEFVRIHKGIMINPDYVASAERLGADEAWVTMLNLTEFQVAKRRIKASLALLRKRSTATPLMAVS